MSINIHTIKQGLNDLVSAVEELKDQPVAQPEILDSWWN